MKSSRQSYHIMEKDFWSTRRSSVEVDAGQVLLLGRVDSPHEKDAAEKDCWYTPGVIDVDNQLVIG